MTYQDNDPGHTNAHNDHANQIAAVQTAVAGKAEATHQHGEADITNLVPDLSSLTGRVAALESGGLPVPIGEADVTNLTTDLSTLSARIAALESAELFVRKTADTSRTSTTSLTDDPELVLAVEANTSYFVDAQLDYEGSTTGDFAVGFTVPAGASLLWTPRVPATSASSSSASTRSDERTATDVAGAGAIGAGSRMSAWPRGILDVAGTAGNITVRWAQNASDPTATILGAGSWLRLRKMG